MATLLFYRLLELIEQRRLSLYQLFVSKMEYMKMKIDGKEITEEEFASLKERVADLKKGRIWKKYISLFARADFASGGIYSVGGIGRSYHLGWKEYRTKVEADSGNGFAP